MENFSTLVDAVGPIQENPKCFENSSYKHLYILYYLNDHLLNCNVTACNVSLETENFF